MPLQTLTPELAAQIAADYPGLQSLNLSNNALRDVRHLQLLPRSLTQLDLGGNRLSALPEELGTWLPDLRLLRLRANALESLRPLIGCKDLQTLDGGANRVVLVSELRFLEPLTQLRHLSLDGNPLANSPTYRREVLAMLPQLQTLDGQDITAAERLYAKLQLKTQLGGGAAVPTSSLRDPTASPAPSPTRLLTPESLQTQRHFEQAISGGNRDDQEETRWEEKEKEDDRNHRVEFYVSDEMGRQPLPLVLAVAATPSPEIPTRKPERRDRNDTRREDAVSQSNNYQTVSRIEKGHSVATSDAGTREMLLKSRVEALEAILAVQDKTMRHTLARFGDRNSCSQLSVASNKGSGVPTVEAVAAVYTRLLAAWREKCVSLMVQTQSSELANEAQVHEYRQQEAQISEDLARCEEKLEMWQQRAADFEAQRDLEVVATHQAEAQRAQANAKAVQAVRGLALERGKLQNLAETVVRFTGGLVRDKVEQLHSGAARLQAKERVELASTLVAHREARLRNSEAALEAERRVWAHRLEQMRNVRLQDQETKRENGGDISNIMARIPADELLRAIRRGDPGVLSAVGGPKKLSKLVSHVEAAIRKLSLAGGTLTWGEFLLFFIPESSVSLAALLEDNEDSGARTCQIEWRLLPLYSHQPEGETKLGKKRKDRKALETLSHAELVQQNAVLLADRKRLRRLLARDAHDLRDRVRGVRREWETKTRELVHRSDRLQREVNELQRETAEVARDVALLEVQRLREQLTMQEQDFELYKKKLETESAERLQHEQDIWQTEIQDARLAHSLLQGDHSKQQVRIRQLERDLARQKEALLAHETERVASLEEKIRRRDAELARLRRERNTILSSLREQEKKLVLATEPTPTECIATQTEEAPRRTVASQTIPVKPRDEGGRMSINEISTFNEQDGGDAEAQGKKKRPVGATATHLTTEDVNLRLQKLQSLTESLLAD
ncbi:Leucine-rich repeat domain, L domain-like [Phytophthora cactorum]|nr:Leucine-rich repeat domain, L domain-like [Phytophthora cactorum]